MFTLARGSYKNRTFWNSEPTALAAGFVITALKRHPTLPRSAQVLNCHRVHSETDDYIFARFPLSGFLALRSPWRAANSWLCPHQYVIRPRIAPTAAAERTMNGVRVKSEFSVAACVVKTSPTALIKSPITSAMLSFRLIEPLKSKNSLARTT